MTREKEMNYSLNKFMSVSVGILLLISLAGTAFGAVELTETEKFLLERISALENRIVSLEGKLGEKDKAEAKADNTQQSNTTTGQSVGNLDSLSLASRISKLEDDAVGSPTDFRAYWDEGLRFSTADEQFKLVLGGRISHDWAWFKQSSDLKRAFNQEEDGTEFRRAFLTMSGLIYDWIEYKGEFDFSSGDPAFEDVYVGFTKIPYFGKIRVGHFDEPFGMELRTSNRHTTFMERGITNTFTPASETGIMAKNLICDDRVFWAAGIFRDTDSVGKGKGDGAYNYTGRIVNLPWYEDGGKKLLHLGVGLSLREPDGTVRFKTRPEAHLSEFNYVDTGDFAAEDEDVVGLEFAWVDGPFSVQCEHIWDRVKMKDGGSINTSAFYVFGSYFLTGESRNYDLGSGTFDRPRPNKNFRGKEGGPGAWELAARYSHIDLNDASIRGGEQDDITLGLNWYLNQNTKFMLNYIRADIDNDTVNGNLDIFMTRTQVDF